LDSLLLFAIIFYYLKNIYLYLCYARIYLSSFTVIFHLYCFVFGNFQHLFICHSQFSNISPILPLFLSKKFYFCTLRLNLVYFLNLNGLPFILHFFNFLLMMYRLCCYFCYCYCCYLCYYCYWSSCCCF
jgi:hypothetical protein